MDENREQMSWSPMGSAAYVQAEEAGGPGQEYREMEAGGVVSREKDWLIGMVRDRSRRMFSHEVESLAMVADELAAALQHSSRTLIENDSPIISRYCDLSSAGLERLAAALRNWDLGTLMSRTRRIACTHPVLFLCGSMAAGFMAVRALQSRPGDKDWGGMVTGRGDAAGVVVTS